MDVNQLAVLPAIPVAGDSNPIPAGTSLDEAWPQINNRLDEISKNTNLDGEYSMADCGYIHSACKAFCKSDYAITFFNRMDSVKMVPMYGLCWQNDLKDELLRSRSKKYYALLELNEAMTALTDQSTVICNRFLELGIYRLLFKHISSEPLNPKKMNDPIRSAVAIGHVYILLNVLRKIEGAKIKYREVKNAVNILQPFRSCANLALSILASMVQFYIINDKENEQINTRGGSFKPIIDTFSESIEGRLASRIKIDLKPIDVLIVVNNLANTNDNNAPRLVEEGALRHYSRVMRPEFGAECQGETARGLRIYALSCPQRLLTDRDCIQGLHELVMHEDEVVRRNAEGALWAVNNPVMNQRAIENLSDSQRLNDSQSVGGARIEEKHVFISYQWDYQDQAKLIADRTRSANMEVWIDVANMYGSVVDRMAEAVEKASVIVVLISQAYKDSVNCRSEAQYAFKLKKRVVPVRVQKDYNPDGWLGLMVGSQIVIDITDIGKKEEEMIKFLREIGPKPCETARRMTPPPPPPPGINGDISSWLNQHGILHLSKWFEGLDEPLLKELASLRKEAASEFFISFRQEQMLLSDRLRLSLALKKSFQL